MALTPQVNFGNMLMTPGGNIAGSCCCESGPQPSSCPDGDPEMVITVTADDVNLPVTWCGITWQPSGSTLGANERYSGQSATVCPTLYRKEKSKVPFGTPYYQWNANHLWYNNVGGKLRIQREANANGATFGFWAAANAISVQPSGGSLARMSHYFGGLFSVGYPAGQTTTYTNLVDSTIAFGQLVQAPRYLDPPGYQLYSNTIYPNTSMFGSYNDGTVTYTWKQGNGW